MRKIKKWFNEFFQPEDFNDLDIASIGEALNDADIRTQWLMGILEDLKRINMDVDRRLLSGSEAAFTDLCAKRQAYQDVLTSVLSAKKTVRQHEGRHNPTVKSIVNLDRVTA